MLISFQISPTCLAQFDQHLLLDRVKGLLQSHQEGRHLVIFGRDTFRWLRKNLQFSDLERSILQRIGGELTQTGSLIKEAKHFINVVDTGIGIRRVTDREVEVSLKYRNFADVLLQPILVAEDIEYDFEIIDLLFSVQSNRPCGHGIRYDPAHGGGARAVAVTKKHAALHRIVCTVFDTDRIAPMHQPEKLTTLVAELDEIDWPLLVTVPLPCSEVENVVPFHIYKYFFSDSHKASVNNLSIIEENEKDVLNQDNDSFWLFFDVKVGLDTSAMSSKLNENVLAWVDQKVNCIKRGGSEAVIQGFGRTALKSLLSNSQFAPEFRNAIKSGSWRRIFSEATGSIYWVAVAPSRRFVC